MPSINKHTEAFLNLLLDHIHARIAWICRAEADAAWVNGPAAHGLFDPERTRLIARAERVLDELERIGGSPRFHPAN